MPTAFREHLMFAFRKVLRPLMRILIRAGVRYDEFVELVSGVYVEAAALDGLGAPDGKPPSRARITIATGVPRREVDQVFDNDGALPFLERSFTKTLAKVLNTWHTDSQFVGPYGIPLELAREGDKGRTFKDLVHNVDARADVDAVTHELFRLGAIVRSGDTHLRVVSRAMIATEEWSPAQLELFGTSLTRLAETLQYNIDGRNTTKRLERQVMAEQGLPPEVIPEFENQVRERVQQLLVDLDNWITPHTERPGPKSPILGVSVFQFCDPPADERTGLRHLVGADRSE